MKNKDWIRKMSYVVFDLDQTLGDITLVYYFLVSLTMKHYVATHQPHMLLYFPKELENSLNHAYQLFVERIAKEEQGPNPIGILRPGIIDIMKQIQSADQIKSVSIYSNNPYLPNLYLVRDLIHRCIGTPIIKGCVHLHDSIRLHDHNINDTVPKTWTTLQLILIENGAPSDLKPSDVLFFDDQVHTILQTDLKENYCKVSEYRTTDSLKAIADIYVTCLEDAKVNIYELFTYMADMFFLDVSDIPPNVFVYSDLFDLLHIVINELMLKYPPLRSRKDDDHGIAVMRSAIYRISNTCECMIQ